MDIKIFIPTKCYLPRMRVHKLFPNKNFYFVCNTEQDADDLAVELQHPRDRILVCHVPEDLGVGRICWVRDWIYQNHVGLGEWSLTVDDNVGWISQVDPEYYNERRINFADYFMLSSEWREIYNKTCPDIMALAQELIAECQEVGTIFGGLAPEDNYFYRASHWRKYGYVKCKFAVYCNDGSTWRPFDQCMFEDYVKSVDVVARYGQVVINNFARAHNPYWEYGGIGSYEERYSALVENAKWLVKHYPGLIKYHPTIPTHVMFAIHTDKKVQQWRVDHGYANLDSK